MKMITNYEEDVYAGLLGKVVGVYMGRPFEGWNKEALEAKWGLVNRYVHEDVAQPLVVSDDDISGTLTFIRAMEDSGKYAETSSKDFGNAWLNYIIENKSVLWWGGAGSSTEHTAYLRLKQGISAPYSGSMALNGQNVAEQIGGQIFVDAYGLVAPGKPELAAELARRAATVSHDGEAVYAAMLLAGMISAAFIEKDMTCLLDIGLSLIPAESTIARVHREVRRWCSEDGDWRITFQRINDHFSPKKFLGGHIVSNHALMVLAWCYAPDNFQMSQAIVNTAGWDTDCNAGNVGSLMGAKVGLAGINKQYDFQGPMADRLVIPTGEGTRGVSDVLIEALHLAKIGRRVMGWEELPAAKNGALFHFEMPGALHGFMAENDNFAVRGTAQVTNTASIQSAGSRAMLISYRELSEGSCARISTPVLARFSNHPYAHMSCPRLFPGMTVTMKGIAGEQHGDNVKLRLFTRQLSIDDSPAAISYSAPQIISAGQPFTLNFQQPDTGMPVVDLGLEINGVNRSAGEFQIDSVDISGTPAFKIPNHIPMLDKEAPGWINSMERIGYYNFIYDDGELTEITAGENRGVLVTGTSAWQDYTITADIAMHMADEAGIIVRYQGLKRYYALLQRAGKLQLICQGNEERVLAEIEHLWPCDEFRQLKVQCRGSEITAWCAGKELFSINDSCYPNGGAGFLAKMGKIGVRNGEIG